MYLLSVFAVILCFIFVRSMTMSGGIWEFMDFTSIALLVLLVVSIMLSAGLLKDLNNAIRLILGKKKEAAMLELKRAKLAVDTMIKVSVYSSIFVTMVQCVTLLHNLSDPAHLGPMISVALLIILYAVMISLLLLPIRAKLEQRILEYIPSYSENDEMGQDEERKKEEQKKIEETVS
ncbi:MAG: hypothetical protein HDQ96_00135 [Lachnospiraceae bacterium]|nr:hypothetical protein [Lachnospiraceae bacterium]